PTILRGRRGGWRCKSSCQRCGAMNLHTKHGNWIPALKAWRRIGITWLTADEMQKHYEQIQHWKNKEPQYAAGAPGKAGTDHGDDQRPVTSALSSNETEKQYKHKTPALPEKGNSIMRKDEAFPAKFLKSSDLDEEDLTVTIHKVVWEEIG